jgi:hypothetical protein
LTANGFRRIAFALERATEGAHMGHPDFRVNGRIFATLHADMKWGMVKLTPGQGSTAVHLRSVDAEAVGEALTLAWRNALAKRQSKKR